MPGLLSFEIVNGDAVKQGLAALIDTMSDLTPFWKKVFAPKYFAMVQDLFATGGRARGGGGRFKSGAWAGLSPRYAIWKRQHYPGRPLLVREGDLRDSVRWSGNSLGAGGIFDAQPLFVIAGTAIPHGKHHQYGTSTMPARPFLPPPDPAVFAPLMKEWILRNARGKTK